MNLGAALNPRLPLLEQVSAFAQAGFSYVDLGLDFPLDSRTLDSGAFRDALKQNGLALHGQTPAHLPFGSAYSGIRNQAVAVAAEAFRILESLGAQSIVLHPDGTFWFQERMADWNAESLCAVAPATRTHILLENLPEKPFHDATGLSALLERTGFSLNLDVGHAHVAGAGVMEALLETGRVGHAHVSDNDGKSDGHLPLGQGTVDWKTAKTALISARVPDVTIESYAGGMQGVLASKKAWDAL